MYRITVNTAITAAQRYQKYSKRVISYDDTIGYQAGAETTNQSYATTENREHLQRLLERLNPDQRACIVLREIEGLSYKEIADALNTNINTVRTRLLRARQAIMKLGRKKEVIGNEV